MSNEKQTGSRVDATLKVLLVFMFSVLSFGIGAFVGKQFSDNQYKLASMEPQSVQGMRGTASIPEGNEKAKPQSALTSAEIAKLAEEFAIEDDEMASDAQLPRHRDEFNKIEKTEEESALDAAEKVANNQNPEVVAPTKTKTESRTPSSLPQVTAQSAIGKYTVQVASYADEEEAKKYAGELKNKGYSAFYIPAEVRGQTWYRVSVGLFATQVEARHFQQELLAKSEVNTAFIQKVAK